MNHFYFGDNAWGLESLLNQEKFASKIDLIYIDPPYNSQQTFTTTEGRASTISRAKSSEVAYQDSFTDDGFLTFLEARLKLAHSLLSNQGSLYLHIDQNFGFDVKLILDRIFGKQNFRNCITRIKSNPKNFFRKAFGNQTDMIFFYTKTDQHIWNEPRTNFEDDDLERLFPKIDQNGRRFTTVPVHAPGETQNGPTGQPWRGMVPPSGRHWRYAPDKLEELDRCGLLEWSKNGVPRKIMYADEAQEKGMKMQDVWTYKDPQFPIYPTEKNMDMLKMIVKTSSNPDSWVLDFFAGSGSTLMAAHLLGRKFIGMDQSAKSLNTVQERFRNFFPLGGEVFEVTYLEPLLVDNQ